ncbi:MAG: hypothetical protein H7301_07820 [Cryobacterium sp.]|nr:hypothetical protein [Oligoflexia bacterium]
MGMKLAFLVSVFVLNASAAVNCLVDPKDPFEPNSVMPSGKFKGACLDTVHDRSYRILTPAEINQNPSLNGFNPALFHFIANFKHDDRFWIAVVPRQDSVDRLVYEVERVPPRWLAAHVELRVVFKPGKGMILFSQTDPNAKPIIVQSVTLSNGAFSMRGGPEYNLWNATQDYFGLKRTLLSTEQTLADLSRTENDVDQYLIAFPKSKSVQDYWEFALNYYLDPNVSMTYHTLFRNCSNMIFHGFDKFLGYSGGVIDPLETMIPLAGIRALQNRQLIHSGSRTKSLKEEYGIPSEWMPPLVTRTN